ncbi:MAG: BON domain-containing protein [Pirellulales bacterium]|nr:BON domain-containing protein [Pirellulales bacterium]
MNDNATLCQISPLNIAPSINDEFRVINKVTRALMATGRFTPGRVKVSSSEGVVKLQGYVKSYFQKQMAQVAALQVIGALQVVNEIIVE